MRVIPLVLTFLDSRIS